MSCTGPSCSADHYLIGYFLVSTASQCHCGAEAFGFLPPTDEVLALAVGLLIIRDGRRGGGGGAGGFGALVFKFPVCKVAVLFEVDTRDCTVA